MKTCYAERFDARIQELTSSGSKLISSTSFKNVNTERKNFSHEAVALNDIS